MLYVNDDIDDSLRKAAAEYQLNAEGTGFDKVLWKMNKGPEHAIQDLTHRKSNRRTLLFLLVLLSFGWMCNLS